MKIVDGWVDTAREYNLMQNSMSRAGLPLTHLVIHGTAGGSDGASIAAYMGGAGVSTHFVISTDGTVWQLVSLEVAAWANAPLNAPRINFKYAGYNPNYWTCSIEFAKPDTTNGIDITQAQRKSGFALVKLICDTYGIPKRYGDANGGIIAHADINSIDRSRCPGTFPWDEMFRTINSEGEEMATVQIGKGIGAHFKDAGNGVWKCDNGFNLGGRIRQYWAFYEGVFGLPKSNEIGLSKAPATLQMFERVILVYDPNNVFDRPPRQSDTQAPEGVYLMHIDQGDGQARVAKPLTDALNKTIADKQAQIDTLQHQLSTTENLEKAALQQQLQSALDAKDKLVNLYKQLVAEASAVIG